MRQLIRYFDISRIYTRVGIITYSSSPIPVSNFASYSRRYDLLTVIRKIRFPRGRSYTGRALRFAGRYLYTGRRSSTRARVLVVVTGSRSSDRVRRPAEMLRQAGIEVFAVGMGGGISMTTLSAIASDRYHVFTGLRLGLRNLLSKLVAKICAATPRTKPTTKRKFGLFVCVACILDKTWYVAIKVNVSSLDMCFFRLTVNFFCERDLFLLLMLMYE